MHDRLALPQMPLIHTQRSRRIVVLIACCVILVTVCGLWFLIFFTGRGLGERRNSLESCIIKLLHTYQGTRPVYIELRGQWTRSKLALLEMPSETVGCGMVTLDGSQNQNIAMLAIVAQIKRIVKYGSQNTRTLVQISFDVLC